MSLVIKTALGRNDIAKVIDQVQGYKAELQEKTDRLIQEVIEDGAKYLRNEIVQLDAVETGELLNSISTNYDTTNQVGTIYSTAPHAIFVEYGTGVRGQTTPHPSGFGQYSDKERWFYFDEREGRWRMTCGMESRPIFWNTAQALPDMINDKAKEIFST